MHRLTKKSVAINQATGIWLVFRILFNDLTLKNAEENLIKREIICLCFFVGVIGDSDPPSMYSLDNILNLHGKNSPIPPGENK